MHVSVQIISQFTYLHLFSAIFMSFTLSRGSQQGFLQLQEIGIVQGTFDDFYSILFATGCSSNEGVKTPEFERLLTCTNDTYRH